MPNFTVYFTGYFSDSFEIEAEDFDEAESIAEREAQDQWVAYSNHGGYTMPFDNVTVEEIQEED